MMPEDYFDSVNSRETFLKFLELLVDDRYNSIRKEKSTPSPPYGSDANGWENAALENFLEAMQAWAVHPQALGEEPKWRDFAQLLLAGKGYE